MLGDVIDSLVFQRLDDASYVAVHTDERLVVGRRVVACGMPRVVDLVVDDGQQVRFPRLDILLRHAAQLSVVFLIVGSHRLIVHRQRVHQVANNRLRSLCFIVSILW